MSRFVLVIDCDSAAFEPYPETEVRRMITVLSALPDLSAAAGTVRDQHGYATGRFRWEPSPEKGGQHGKDSGSDQGPERTAAPGR